MANLEKTGKLPPQVIELEEAVLGALMIEDNSIDLVIDKLRTESFYKPSHKVVFEAIMKLYSDSEKIDMLTVTQALRAMGKLDLVGGASSVMKLTSHVNSSANIETHARIIQEHAMKRDLIHISAEIQKFIKGVISGIHGRI